MVAIVMRFKKEQDLSRMWKREDFCLISYSTLSLPPLAAGRSKTEGSELWSGSETVVKLLMLWGTDS